MGRKTETEPETEALETETETETETIFACPDSEIRKLRVTRIYLNRNLKKKSDQRGIIRCPIYCYRMFLFLFIFCIHFVIRSLLEARQLIAPSYKYL